MPRNYDEALRFARCCDKSGNGFYTHKKNIFGALTRLPDSDLGEYDEDVEVNVDLNGV